MTLKMTPEQEMTLKILMAGYSGTHPREHNAIVAVLEEVRWLRSQVEKLTQRPDTPPEPSPDRIKFREFL